MSLPMGICSLRLLVVFLFLHISVADTSWADEVYFFNGDRLSGTIVRMEEDTLILETAYSGEIRINWERIKGLYSQTPLVIQFYDGSQYKGPVVYSESEGFQMRDPQKVLAAETQDVLPKSLELGTIAAINPIPWFRYTADASLGGNRTTGNSDTQGMNGSLTATGRMSGHRLSLGGRYNYGESVGKVTARNGRGSLTYDYFLTDKIFLNVEELFEQDSFQDLTLRSSTTAGVGYQFFDSEEHKLDVVGGVGLVHQDFKTRPTIQSPTVLWSVNWAYWLMPKVVNFFLTHQGFKDVGADSSALRVNSNQGVRIWLNKHLYMNFEYDIRFNSQPLLGNKKLDEAFIFGVGFGLGNF